MSTHYTMTATKRDRCCKGVARALRRENRVPAVVYGANKPPRTYFLCSERCNFQFLKGGMKKHTCVTWTLKVKKSVFWYVIFNCTL